MIDITGLRMDLLTLKYFCTVAEEGSFSRAAERLSYAQSNLSTKMINLEDEMGTPLFYRSSRGVTLTPKGELLLKYSTNLLNLAEEAEIAIKDNGDAKGQLTIGSMESTTITYLSSFLVRYREKNPNITLRIDTGITDTLIQKVLDHKLDGAFIGGKLNHSELFTKQVRDEELVLIAAKNSVSSSPSVEELLSKPLLAFPEGCSYRKILVRLATERGLTTKNIYEFGTLSGIFNSCVAGLGTALFPKCCIEQYKEYNSLVTLSLEEGYATIPTLFIYRKDSYLSSAMCSFINAIGKL